MGHFFGEHRAVVPIIVFSSVVVFSSAIVYIRRRQQSITSPWHESLRDRKPQDNFHCVLADNSLAPFTHLRIDGNEDQFSHPFSERVRVLLDQPPLDFQFMESDYERPAGMGGAFKWIETKDELQALAQVLSEETQFAVDTEQHSFHSFHGFTALVQISTRKIDYLVDSIALHDYMNILGPVFANPNICKVFHGADSDIIWLQRDFHIYVVNMFDTAKACLILGKPQRSLAYLLQIYCDVVTNKAFQRADWRLRPLPGDMVQYARTDAHYLLYIAHLLCVELVESSVGLLKEAILRSNLACLQLYEKEGVSASATSTATSMLSRFGNSRGFPLSSQGYEDLLNLVTRLCQWRDHVARKEDESLRSVLSDRALMALATSHPLTSDLIYATIAVADEPSQALEGVNSPSSSRFASPSPIVGRHINDLCAILQRTNECQLGELVENTLDQPRANWRTLFSNLVQNTVSQFKVSGVYENGGKSKDGPASIGEHKVPRKWRQGSAEKSRMQFVEKFSCKAPVYHNCRIYADDGRLLCYCDRKKLDWYVSRGLAEFVQEEPPAVRLLFEPKGRPEDEGNAFYIQSKSNRCVGCGESSHYLRYRIIPSCYRQHFPEHLKSHRSHDIVLLCVDCHEVAHKAAEKHKRLIAVEYGVPLFAKVMDAERLVRESKDASIFKEGELGVSPLELKNAAMALVRHGLTIPSQRRAALEGVVRTYYGRDNISKQDLHAILVRSMRPHQRRRFSNKVLYGGAGSAARDLDHMQNKSPSDELDNTTCVQRNETQNGSSLVAPGETVDRASVVDLRPPADVIDYEASAQNLDEIGISSDGILDGEDQVSLINKDQTPRNSSGQENGRKNESLLGHGIHGRRVVEILLEQEGEDGIRNFSQRWRKVFVEALQPAFLPEGWNISHSGRREFGDFSVYKPIQELQY